MLRSIIVPASLCLALVVAGCGSGQANGDSKEAASVNGHAISMASYTKGVRYQRYLSAQSTQDIDVCSVKAFKSACRQLKRTVLSNLINQELVREYAQAHHITVAQADFNRQWTQIMTTQFHNDLAVARNYAHNLGMTVSDLKAITRQGLLQQAVMYHVTKNMPVYDKAVKVGRIVVDDEKQVQFVQQQLRAGQSFFDIAARIALAHPKGLCKQGGCGTLGWLPYSFITGNQVALKTARVGSVIGPLVGGRGFTFLLVEARESHYRLTAQQELAKRNQLFIAWLKRQKAHATVKQYVTI